MAFLSGFFDGFMDGVELQELAVLFANDLFDRAVPQIGCQSKRAVLLPLNCDVVEARQANDELMVIIVIAIVVGDQKGRSGHRGD